MADVLNTVQEDDCCAKALGKVLLSGALDGKDTWTHSRCGVTWTATWVKDGKARHWMPYCPIEVW